MDLVPLAREDELRHAEGLTGKHRDVLNAFSSSQSVWVLQNFNGSNTFGTMKTCSRQG